MAENDKIAARNNKKRKSASPVQVSKRCCSECSGCCFLSVAWSVVARSVLIILLFPYAYLLDRENTALNRYHCTFYLIQCSRDKRGCRNLLVGGLLSE